MRYNNNYKHYNNNYVKPKSKLGSIILVILAITIMLSVFGVFTNKKDGFSRVLTTWQVGYLLDGEVSKDVDTSITTGYIKLEDELKLQLKNNYKVKMSLIEFYDKDKEFLTAYDIAQDIEETLVLTTDMLVDAMDSTVAENVKYIRISFDFADDNGHIDVFELIDYSSKITIYSKNIKE